MFEAKPRTGYFKMDNILILHGWGSCAKNWDRVKGILENQGYKAFVPDLPGFGENPPPSKPWSVDDYVEWIRDFCEKNNLSQFFLLGHSFGGGLAVKFINSFPEKVRGLILVAPKLRRHKILKYYIALVLAKTGKLIFSIPILSFFQPLARKVLYVLIGIPDYYILDLRLDFEKAITMKGTFKKIVKEDLLFCLPKIKVPTLVIWGKKDKIIPIKDAYLMNKEIRGSKLEIIEDGRHALNLEMPEILAEKVLNFLKS